MLEMLDLVSSQIQVFQIPQLFYRWWNATEIVLVKVQSKYVPNYYQYINTI